MGKHPPQHEKTQPTQTKLSASGALPTEDNIANIASLLWERYKEEKTKQKYAPVRHVLSVLGTGAVIGFALAAPKAAPLLKLFIESEKDWEEWKRYNPAFLRRSLALLRKQKLVEIEEDDGYQVVRISQEGRRRVLRYALDELSITKPKRWDGRWRLIIYDVWDKKKTLRNSFRQVLKSLGFLMLQKSVWLFPYPCEKEIAFLREYFGVGNEVLYVIANSLEYDQPYREYFGLD